VGTFFLQIPILRPQSGLPFEACPSVLSPTDFPDSSLLAQQKIFSAFMAVLPILEDPRGALYVPDAYSPSFFDQTLGVRNAGRV